MTAADRLAEIRHRHLYDVDLGRWDEDEVGMLDALDAVLALCDNIAASSSAIGRGVAIEVRDAITHALGGGA